MKGGLGKEAGGRAGGGMRGRSVCTMNKKFLHKENNGKKEKWQR